MQNRYPVLGTIKDWVIEPEQRFALAIADPKGKQAVAEAMEARGAVFASLIHPRCEVSPSAKIGRGVIFYPASIVGPDTVLGDFVTLLRSPIGHDTTVGDYTTISSLCNITGRCHIGRGVFIAGSAALVPGVRIGDGAYVGMGSVVLHGVRSNTTVFGNPAKRYEL